MKKPKTASQILKKYEDANEYHFHKLDRNWIEEAMAEYSAQNCDLIQELFNRPAQVLKPLEDLYRKDYPRLDGGFYVPDRTKFYEWIVNKILTK